MERDELEKRYRQAQFHAQAQIAEMQAQEQPEEDPQQDSEPTAPTLAQIAQIMGVKPQKDTERYMSEDDRLRRWAGLK